MATVKLFGAFQDMAGWAEREIDGATLGAIKAVVAADNPGLAERLAHASAMVILNAVLLPGSARDDALILGAGDEIAFGPPVSGG